MKAELANYSYISTQADQQSKEEPVTAFQPPANHVIPYKLGHQNILKRYLVYLFNLIRCRLIEA